jgi:hypothetical protein
MTCMTLLAATTVTFPASAFVPLALGFFGLGTGYLIYGPAELFGLPERSRPVDLTTGIWGIWMPGFLQFLTGVYLWAGLLFFHTFRAPTLYMAALAFTAFGVHWFALGMARVLGGDPRPNEFMAVSFTVLSALGITVFFKAGDWPVGLVFVGLAAVYVSEFLATMFTLRRSRPAALDPGAAVAVRPQPTRLNAFGERALGFSRLVTGAWLMYLTFAATLNTTSGTHLPL